MSRTVDERIVQMTFQNEQFQSKAKDTISTVKKLGEALLFKNGTSGLENIQSAANRFSLTSITDAVSSVKQSFSVMEVAAITAISNIVNKATNAGISLAKSLTVDQIGTGFTKYAEKTQSVQTLVNSTGKSVDEINSYLDKLMWYSDETSYGFTDMTKALSTMVSSGGNIDNLIPMIEGMANSVAYAGKGATEFSRVIYNLNQSYGQGYLSLMDWKSVENAGAGSKQLKQILIDTAEELGTVQKGLMTVGNFNTELSNKYITSAVMEKGFAKFATLTEAAYEAVQKGDYKTTADAIAALADSYDTVAVRAFKSAQEAKSFTEAIEATKDAVSSSWMSTFEAIFGNYDEAKAVWTDLTNFLYDFVVAGAETRVEILETWKSLYNPTTIGEGAEANEMLTQTQELFYSLESVALSLKEKISEAWHSIFPTDIEGTAQGLFNVISRITDGIWNLNDYISGTSSIYDFFGGTDANRYWNSLADGYETGFTSLEEYNKAYHKAQEEWYHTRGTYQGFEFPDYGTATTALSGVLEVIRAIASALRVVKDYATILWQSGIKPLADSLKPVLEDIFVIIGNIASLFTGKMQDVDSKTESFRSAVLAIKNVLEKIIDVIKSVTGYFRDLTTEWASGSDTVEKSGEQFSLFKTILDGIGAVFRTVANIISGVKDAFSGLGSVLSNIISKIKEALGNLKSALSDFWSANGGNVTDVARTGLGAYFLVSLGTLFNKIKSFDLSKLNLSKIFSSLAGKGSLINSIKETFSTIKTSLEELCNAKIKTAMIKEIGNSLLKLAASMLILAAIDPERMKQALGGMTAAMLELVSMVAVLSKIQGGKGFKAASLTTLISSLGTALLKISVALAIMGSIDEQSLGNAVGAMTVILAELAVMCGVLSKLAANKGLKQSKNVGKMMSKLGFALIEIAAALKIMSSINSDEMKLALTGFTAVMVELGVFVAALSIVSNKFGKINFKQIGTGMAALGFAMIEIAAAMKIMGTMDWKEMGIALISLFGSLATIFGMAVGISKLAGAGSFAAISASMLMLAPSLIVLAGALKIMGTMNWEEMGIALITLFASLATVFSMAVGISKLAGAGSFAVISASMLLLAPALLVLAAALKVMGSMSWDEIIRSLVALAGALVVIGGLSALFGVLSPLMIVFAAGLALVGVACLAAANGFLKMAEAMAVLSLLGPGAFNDMLSMFREFVGTVIALIPTFILGIVDAVLKTADQLIQLVVEIIRIVCSAINEALPTLIETLWLIIQQIVDLAVQLVELLCNKFNELFPIIIETLETLCAGLIELAISVIWMIVDALEQNGPQLITKAVQIVTDMIAALVIALGEAVVTLTDALFTMLIDTINGVADSIRSNAGELGAALGNLASALIEGIASALWNCVSTLGENLFGGIRDWISNKLSGKDDGSSEEAGSNMAVGIGTGLTSETATVQTSAANLNKTITDEISGSSTAQKKNTDSGKNLMTQLEDGMDKETKSVTKKATEIKNEITDNMDGKEEATASGKNTMQGLLDGVSDSGYLSSLYSAGVNAANAFNSGYNNTLQINSPSRVMMKGGMYAILGLVNGIKDYLPDVEESGSNVADAFNDALITALEMSEDLLDSDMNPVISPIVDLSNVRDSQGVISNLLNGSEISVANARLASQIQNGSNSNAQINQQKPNVTLNVNFSVSNAGKDLSEADINKYSKMIANRVNEELGLLV